MHHYDYVVILCASTPNEAGGFDEIDNNGLYLGGQVRMQAAAKLYKDPAIHVGKLIVVGGGVQEPDEAKKWEKVVGMRKFLEKQGVPRHDIVGIVSGPDTTGNFRALRKVYGEELQEKRVGILTNFYHLPRTMRIAQDTLADWNTEFIPICAESISMTGIPSSLQHIPELTARITAEIKGLSDWENGEYREQHKPISDWKGEILTSSIHADIMQ